jgi:penicillin amidase
VLVLPLCASSACRRSDAPPPLAAQVTGTIEIEGLSAPVRVVRDRWGVPHIYARSRDDLFAAQGFVQAQDRLFQMDLWRRSAQGRLSEVLGANFIERDAMTRRMQFRGDLDAEWASYAPDARAIAAAFVRGINAWVAIVRERPPDAFVVAGWKPSFWVETDLLNRTDAFTASRNAVEEVARSGLDERIAEAVRRAGAPPFFAGLAADIPGATAPPRDRYRVIDRDPIRRVSPDTTAIRTPSHAAAARDGHLVFSESPPALTSPASRYLVHLNAPGWNVIGATAPWRPGVAIGHNERVGWAAVPIDVDTQDIFVVERQAGQERIVKDAIVVKGSRTPFAFETEYTGDGVVVASDREHDRVFSLRWSGFEAGAAPELAALVLDRAQNWTEVRSALERWKMPPRRIVYADVDGNIAYQDAVLMPERVGGSGRQHGAWSGWVAMAALPHAFNPASIDVSDNARGVPSASPSANFGNPLGITAAAHEHFGVGPVQRPARDDAPIRMLFDMREWDRSRALDAPGQTETGAHFNDQAGPWSRGDTFPLVFSATAVAANAETTLVLQPKSVSPPAR